MKIILSSRSEKKLRQIHKIDQIAIAQKIRSLTDKKIHSQSEKLRGYKDIFRLRVGDYRIVYRKRSDSLYIVLIAHRREIYHLLQHLFG